LRVGIGNLVKNVRKHSSKHWFEQTIDDYLSVNKSENRTGTEFHPSSVGNCPRLIQFNLLGMVSEQIEPRVRRIFDHGHDMHRRYKK